MCHLETRIPWRLQENPGVGLKGVNYPDIKSYCEGVGTAGLEIASDIVTNMTIIFLQIKDYVFVC